MKTLATLAAAGLLAFETSAHSEESAREAPPAPFRSYASIAAVGSYGGGQSPRSYNFGGGVDVGYRFAWGLHLGALFRDYAGDNETIPGSNGVGGTLLVPTAISSVASTLGGAQVGWDFSFDALSVRPFVAGGLSWLHGRTCVGSACRDTINENKLFWAPGLAVVVSKGHLTVGVDFRYVVVPGASVNESAPVGEGFVGYRI